MKQAKIKAVNKTALYLSKLVKQDKVIISKFTTFGGFKDLRTL